MERIKWPFGDATILALSASGAQDLVINNNMTIVDGVTTQATDNRTLNLSVSDSTLAGAILLLKTKTDVKELTVFGALMQGADYAGVDGKTKIVTCIYDGTNFVEAGTPVQID